jgi:hypothetical protein
MPKHDNLSESAAGLQSHIRAQGDFSHVTVTARGRQLHIRVADEIIARVEGAGSTYFSLAFRNHSGHWEPMPVHGSLAEVARGAVEALAPYLRCC